jgi:succinate dehydrogenase/fumarate reductase cytochrome b subunit
MTTLRELRLSRIHRVVALILAVFVGIHMLNHVVGLAGQAQHIAFMTAVRPYYRNAVLEPFLLALFASQAITGIVMVVRGWPGRRGRVEWLQALSGMYLSVFLLVHIVSVIAGRVALKLDTDFRFAAAGFHVPGWPWYFGPYYALAVFALFAHAGCAVYWNVRTRFPSGGRGGLLLMTSAGFVLGLAIVAGLAGLLYPVNIPFTYLATYSVRW